MQHLSPKAISFSLRCRQHAARTPTRVAVLVVDERGGEIPITWHELDTRVDRAAVVLRAAGTGPQSLVIVSLPTGAEHLIAALASWRLGACVLPLNPQMPELERNRILELAGEWRQLISVACWSAPGIPTIAPEALDKGTCVRIADITPCPGKAIGSGGSTGRPKIIINPKPWAHVPGHWGPLTRAGLAASQTQLITGALHHNIGFLLSHIGLFEGHTLILPRRFDAAQAVDLIEKHRVQFVGWLPIMMQRIAKMPDVERRDFSSLEGLYHSGGACAQWVKRAWLRMVPPGRLWEIYGSTEDAGIIMINGDEWLERPGSVGRPYHSAVVVLDEHGKPVPAGQVGEIYLRSTVPLDAPLGLHWPQQPSFQYVGAPAPAANDEYTSVGDLGWLDADGFLFLADRRVDMIKTGGVSVYPAEVEAALSQSADIQDAVVVGIPDDEWGHRVHAIVQPATWPSSLSWAILDAFCRQRLTAHKLPKTYELCATLPRDSSGKINRTALRDQRRDGRVPGLLLQRTAGQLQ